MTDVEAEAHERRGPGAEITRTNDPDYDFGGACFDLDKDEDREIIRFILSQALFGEATGVYCGKSLYAAGSLEAARFYVRQAKQELAHLALFADIFRALDMKPVPAHWVIKLLSSSACERAARKAFASVMGDLFRIV